jgi:hypothetical protein
MLNSLESSLIFPVARFFICIVFKVRCARFPRFPAGELD